MIPVLNVQQTQVPEGNIPAPEMNFNNNYKNQGTHQLGSFKNQSGYSTSVQMQLGGPGGIQFYQQNTPRNQWTNAGNNQIYVQNQPSSNNNQYNQVAHQNYQSMNRYSSVGVTGQSTNFSSFGGAQQQAQYSTYGTLVQNNSVSSFQQIPSASSQQPIYTTGSTPTISSVIGSMPPISGPGEKLYQMLQKKARQSYKRLQRTQGSIQQYNVAFFYISNTQAANNGVLFPAMISIRQKSKQYNPQWTCFNQPINGFERQKPNVLVVADELFMMQDHLLQQKARYACPNSFKESQNNTNARFKNKESWQNNMFCVQAHAFNNGFEPLDITVYDYLLSFAHEIISFKMMDRLVEYWNSNKIEWHLDRGLKVNTDGTPISNPSCRGVTSSLLMSMNKYQKQSFQCETRMGVYCVSCFKPGSLTAHMSSSGASPNNKTYAHECHYFQQNTPQQQQAMKATLGPKVYVGKYDLPAFNILAPYGTSIFQLQKEREFAEQNTQFLNQKYDDNITNMKRKKNKDEKHPKCIEEPKPGANHVICAICREQFKDYLEHIFSQKHKRGVENNLQIFHEIDKVIDDISEFQSNKKIIDEQRNLEQQRIKKLKSVNNPELITTGTDDMSSGASNRSKTTMCTDVQTNSTGTDKIQINIEYDEPIKRRNRREQKQDAKFPPVADVIEIRDSSSSSKGRRSQEPRKKRKV